MPLQTNLRIASATPVSGPPAVRARELREPRPIESGDAAGRARSRTAGEQAAIVSFGADAVQRAHQRDKPSAPDSEATESEARGPEGDQELSDEQQRAVDDLQRRDHEVRTHEQTHRSVGGQYAGAIHLDYQQGPDGARYAVSGTTAIDTAPVANDPEATLRKMQIVQRAASAPANPSGADRQIASGAAHQAAQARAEMAAARYDSARELAPDRGEATPGSAAPFSGRPGEPEAAAPGRLLAIRV
jgi:hypothetical protein